MITHAQAVHFSSPTWPEYETKGVAEDEGLKELSHNFVIESAWHKLLNLYTSWIPSKI